MAYFSVEEAERLIPELEKIVESVYSVRERIEKKHRQLGQLEGKNGPPDEIAIARGQLDFLVSTMQDWLAKIEELGCVPKGIDPFLVDFPFRLAGREVFLCWKFGEKRIQHYHGLDEGFAGRRPLPAKTKRQA